MNGTKRSKSYDSNTKKGRTNDSFKTIDRIINKNHAQQLIDQNLEYEKQIEQYNHTIDQLKIESSQSGKLIDSTNMNLWVNEREEAYQKISSIRVLYEQAINYMEQRGRRKSI